MVIIYKKDENKDNAGYENDTFELCGLRKCAQVKRKEKKDKRKTLKLLFRALTYFSNCIFFTAPYQGLTYFAIVF